MSQFPGQPSFAAETTPEERSYGTFMHVVPLVTHLGAPFILPLIAAIIMWQVKKDQSTFLDDHGRESANFQISMLIYAVIVLPIATLITCGLGALLAIPLLVLNVWGCVLAARAAHRGQYFRYPMSLRFL